MADLIPPPRTSKKLDEKIHWDPQRLVLSSSPKPSPIATEQGQHSMRHDALGDPSQPSPGNDKDTLTASVSSSSRAQSCTRPLARRPSLRRSKRIAPRTFPQPVRPRSSKILLSAKEGPPKKSNATSLWTPLNASPEPQHTSRFVASGHPAKTLNTGPPRTYPFRPGGSYPKTNEVRRPVYEVRVTG